MRIKITSLLAAAASVLMISMKPHQEDFIPEIFKKADKQYNFLAKEADVLNKFPRTTKDGKLVGTDEWDWTGGFFSGFIMVFISSNCERGN
jgi:hypothetical protein